MKRFIRFLAILGLLAGCTGGHEQAPKADVGVPWLVLQLDSTRLLVSEVLRDLHQPWEITWGADGRLWFTERAGHVYRMQPHTGKPKRVLKIPGIYAGGNTPGLLGLVLHPDFLTEPFVYLHYTYLDSSIVGELDHRGRPNQVRSRVVRYRYLPEEDTLSQPQVLLTDIFGSRGHNGSRLIISSDKKLIFAMGDGADSHTAQDPQALTGKVLRMNLDGSVPADNPLPGSYFYSMGHRNHQGLVEARGKFYTSEHGPNNDDELNLIKAGGNYGWPHVEGHCDTEPERMFCDTVAVTEPLFTWTPTIAPAGLDYYDHPAIPEWRHHLLLTTLKGRSLQLFALEETGESLTAQKIFLQQQLGRLRDLCVSATGDIYLITSNTDWHIPRYEWMYERVPPSGNDRIIRISPLTEWKEAYQELPVVGQDSAQVRLFVQAQVDPDLPSASLYQTHCAPCHLPGGEGIPDFTPPLIATAWVADRASLIETTLFGLSGEIEVQGKRYDEIMPGYAALLTDEELTEILNFVRRSLNAYPDSISRAEVAAIRKGRGD